MRRIIFIVLIIFLSISSARNYSVKAAVQDQMNIDAYVDARISGIGVGAPLIPDNAPPFIYDVQISEISPHSAKVSWKTNENASAHLYYGKTLSYEIGILQDHPESIGLFHGIAIGGLEEGTKYYFQLRSLDSAGNQGIKDGYSFATLSDFKAPPNVNSFMAKPLDGKIILEWENPEGLDFAGVQINKNIGSPSLDPQSGEVIYSGLANGFEDKDVKNKITYFYTAFSFDALGNFSSGAIASAVGIVILKPVPSPAPTPTPTPTPTPSPTSMPLPITHPPDVKDLETISDSKDGKIIIKWTNPEEGSFEKVEVRKSRDFPALIPGEGEIAYEGRENSFEDKNIEKEIVYYYTVFTKDKFGRYSSGVAASGTLKKLPPSLISEISIGDVSFISSKEALLLPISKDGKIHIFPNSGINVYYDAKNLPQTLKTIILTIGKSSYILNADEKKEFYRTKFISPRAAGSHPMTISVLDFRGGRIFQAKAELVVEEYGKVFEFKERNYESKSFFERKILDIGYWVLGIFDKKEFLNLSKMEVEGASVELYGLDESGGSWILWNSGKYNQKNPRLTDAKGEFGFMAPRGKYKVSVRKDGYYPKEETIEIESNLINGEIRIERKFDWRILLIVLAVLVTAYVVWRKMKRRRRMKLDLR